MTTEELRLRILDLDEEAYTSQQIALALNVTEQEVKLVVDRWRRWPACDSLPKSRCDGCGMRVTKPCVLCRTRRIGAYPEASVNDGGPLPGDPTPEEIAAMCVELRGKEPRSPRWEKEPAIREYWTVDVVDPATWG